MSKQADLDGKRGFNIWKSSCSKTVLATSRGPGSHLKENSRVVGKTRKGNACGVYYFLNSSVHCTKEQWCFRILSKVCLGVFYMSHMSYALEEFNLWTQDTGVLGDGLGDSGVLVLVPGTGQIVRSPSL